MPFSYANPSSGPSAGGIGWFNFENLSMNPGDTITGLTGTLSNGNIVTFDMSLTLLSGTPRQFNATAVPTYPLAQFGVEGYTGIVGNVAMYAALNDGTVATSLFTISNIVVKTPANVPISNYSVLIADTESTNLFEGISGQTDGGAWDLFTTVGTGNAPTLNGVGTQTFDIIGNQQFGKQVAYVLNTQTPSQILLTLIDQDPVQTRQGFAIGFATTRVTLQKNIGQRIDASDQFTLNITGTPASQAITTGASNGIQTEFAQVYAIPNSTYRLDELMAPGSVSTLGDYILTVSASNATPQGTVPPIGPLPINFTPALGDDVTYTFLNAIPEKFTKTVDKAFANVGEVLTYTITVDNPNSFAISNVLVTDNTPSGTTYLGNISSSQPYTGTDLTTGITFTSIPPYTTATISWQVQVDSVPPVQNPIPNFGNVKVPGGVTGITNIVKTQVNTALVSTVKAVDKAFAIPNDVLTYTLTLTNTGNVSANNVVITDAIPSGTTFVLGSVTGATGTPPTLTLNAPIPAGGSTVVTYKVKVGAVVPNPNPIPNKAYVAYTFTIDPENPNGGIGNSVSNTVTTQISIATLNVTKAVDKSVAYVGDIITYHVAVQNTGNVPANNVVITDIVTNGVTYIPGTLTANVPVMGTPASIQIVNPIAPGATVSIAFQVKVMTMPNPNPVINQAVANYTYTVDPQNPDSFHGTNKSNEVCTLIFKYQFSQQITDLIQSVALEQAALAELINVEGVKIQTLVAMGGVSTQELLCLNNSVSETLDSIAMLEAILKQKLSAVDCQINGCSI